MGRVIGQPLNSLTANVQIAGVNIGTPISGVFGTGKVKFFHANENWTVPAGISKSRSRCFGSGGDGILGGNAAGGAGGGGFALRENVHNPGDNVAVTVATAASATSSFGAFHSATGGVSADATGGGTNGGAGVGGDG